jgi:hypothetical protein
MKGFVITLDAVVAISFFLFAMIIIMSQVYQPRSPGQIYLKMLTLDTISVLEKTGRVDQALSGNTSALQDMIEATPKLACMDIYIYNSTGDLVAGAMKSDCEATTGIDMQVVARPERFNEGDFIIKAESWSRKESD